MHSNSASSTAISSDQTLVANNDKRRYSTHFPFYSVGDIVLYDYPGYSHTPDRRAWRTYFIARNDLVSTEEEWLHQLVEIDGPVRTLAAEKQLYRVHHPLLSRVRLPDASKIRPSAVTGVFNSPNSPHSEPCWLVVGVKLDKKGRKPRVVYDVRNEKVIELYGIVREVGESMLEQF